MGQGAVEEKSSRKINAAQQCKKKMPSAEKKVFSQRNIFVVHRTTEVLKYHFSASFFSPVILLKA
jgi:hypothetical protein